MYLVLTLDVTDLDLQTRFWCGALSYEHVGGVGQYRALVDPTGKGPKLLLQQVEEPKTAKHRLHLDVHVEDIDAEAERPVGLGAAIGGRVDEFGRSWLVGRDPEGNEFCIVPV